MDWFTLEVSLRLAVGRADGRETSVWGGSAMIGLQEMLMQTDDKKIILFPAWPKDWDVDFKLHAPYQTIVEGRLVNGKLIDLKVTPAERQKDLINLMDTN